MARQAFSLILASILFLAACSDATQGTATALPPPTSLPTFPTSAPTDTPDSTPTSDLASPTSATTLTPDATPIPTLPAGTLVRLAAIQMLNELEGWGIAEQDGRPVSALKTMDSGLTWVDRSSGVGSQGEITGEKIAAWSFLDTDHTWIMYSSDDPMEPPPAEPVVWFTVDGGVTWEASSPLQPHELAEFFIPGEMRFTDPQHGSLMIHVGAGMSHDYISLYKTSDGGREWDLAADPTTASEIQGCQKSGMSFSGESLGWLTVDCLGVVPGAIVYQSEDDGESWSQVTLPPPETFPDLFPGASCSTAEPLLFDDQGGELLMRCRSGSTGEVETNFLYRTIDRGATWESSSFPGGDLEVVDDLTTWAVGESIYLSQDGGRTWELTGAAPWVGDAEFIDKTNGWLLNPAVAQNLIARTTDGGQSWINVEPLLFPD
ncbi:MAG TPA: hypothetical protein VJ768_06720 [Anaerolineales bacterium]|nr:hypothetical protein [Anaerolineales bacterium]